MRPAPCRGTPSSPTTPCPSRARPARWPPRRVVTAYTPRAAANEARTETARPAPYRPSPVHSETSRISVGYRGKNAAELPSSVIRPVAPGTGFRAGSYPCAAICWYHQPSQLARTSHGCSPPPKRGFFFRKSPAESSRYMKTANPASFSTPYVSSTDPWRTAAARSRGRDSRAGRPASAGRSRPEGGRRSCAVLMGRRVLSCGGRGTPRPGRGGSAAASRPGWRRPGSRARPGGRMRARCGAGRRASRW